MRIFMGIKIINLCQFFRVIYYFVRKMIMILVVNENINFYYTPKRLTFHNI